MLIEVAYCDDRTQGITKCGLIFAPTVDFSFDLA